MHQSKKTSKTGKKRRQKNTNEAELDLSKELHPLSHYISDRSVLLQQLFSVTKTSKVKNLIKENFGETMSVKQLKKLCLKELQGMSSKRIKSVMEGQEMEESSATEEDEDDETANITSSKVVTSNKSIKSKEASVFKNENKERGSGVPLKDRKLKVNLKRRSPVIFEEDSQSKKAKGDETQTKEDGGKTEMELLELEMRARAIKALLKKGDLNKDDNNEDNDKELNKEDNKEDEINGKEDKTDDNNIIKEDNKKDKSAEEASVLHKAREALTLSLMAKQKEEERKAQKEENTKKALMDRLLEHNRKREEEKKRIEEERKREERRKKKMEEREAFLNYKREKLSNKAKDEEKELERQNQPNKQGEVIDNEQLSASHDSSNADKSIANETEESNNKKNEDENYKKNENRAENEKKTQVKFKSSKKKKSSSYRKARNEDQSEQEEGEMSCEDVNLSDISANELNSSNSSSASASENEERDEEEERKRRKKRVEAIKKSKLQHRNAEDVEEGELDSDGEHYVIDDEEEEADLDKYDLAGYQLEQEDENYEEKGIDEDDDKEEEGNEDDSDDGKQKDEDKDEDEKDDKEEEEQRSGSVLSGQEEVKNNDKGDESAKELYVDLESSEETVITEEKEGNNSLSSQDDIIKSKERSCENVNLVDNQDDNENKEENEDIKENELNDNNRDKDEGIENDGQKDNLETNSNKEDIQNISFIDDLDDKDDDDMCQGLKDESRSQRLRQQRLQRIRAFQQRTEIQDEIDNESDDDNGDNNEEIDDKRDEEELASNEEEEKLKSTLGQESKEDEQEEPISSHKEANEGERDFFNNEEGTSNKTKEEEGTSNKTEEGEDKIGENIKIPNIEDTINDEKNEKTKENSNVEDNKEADKEADIPKNSDSTTNISEAQRQSAFYRSFFHSNNKECSSKDSTETKDKEPVTMPEWQPVEKKEETKKANVDKERKEREMVIAVNRNLPNRSQVERQQRMFEKRDNWRQRLSSKKVKSLVQQGHLISKVRRNAKINSDNKISALTGVSLSINENTNTTNNSTVSAVDDLPDVSGSLEEYSRLPTSLVETNEEEHVSGEEEDDDIWGAIMGGKDAEDL